MAQNRPFANLSTRIGHAVPDRVDRLEISMNHISGLGATAVVAALIFFAPGELTSQSPEEAVVQVVQDLFDAMRAGDGDALNALFLDGARLSGPSRDAEGRFVVRNTPIDRFVAGIVTASADAVLDERIYNPEVRISDNLATVWVEYDFYRDDDFSHCGVDAFQLAYDGDAWKILQIADTRRQEGCPER